MVSSANIFLLEGVVTMMQPMDIKSQNFRKGLFGYNKVDVDQYVDTVYRAYDELFTENKNLRDEKDRLNKVIEENRLKLFELENQVQGVTPVKEEKKAEVKEEKAAPVEEKVEEKKDDSLFEDPFADISFDEPKKDGKIKMSGASKEEPKAEEKKDDSATSKFFQQSNDDVFGDGDDVFVGEIEDNRKPNKVMIGDGEEEGNDDFEFL